MTYLRWLHKSWNVFWTFIGVLTLTVAILFGAIVGMLQLQPVKDQVAVQLQNQFNENFEGVISIGKLEGLLPLRIQISDLKIYPDSSDYNPVFEANKISASLDIWSILKEQLVLRSISVESPNLIYDPESNFSLEKAFVPKTQRAYMNNLSPVNNYQVIIPSVRVVNGNILVRNIFSNGNQVANSDSLTIRNLSMDMFFEYTADQRFIDIDRIRFDSPELGLPEIELYGQIYNDDRFLEFNAINVNIGNSALRFSGEADGVNILESNVAKQFANSTLSMVVERLTIQPEYLSRFLPGNLPNNANLQAKWSGEGKIDSLNFREAEFIFGDSFALLDGYLTNLDAREDLRYGIDLNTLIAGKNELSFISPKLDSLQIEALSTTLLEGEIRGNVRDGNTGIQVQASHPERGVIRLNGDLFWGEQTAFDFNFTTDSLELGHLIDSGIARTRLTLNGEVKSSSFDIMNSEGGLVIQSSDGLVGDRTYDHLSVLAYWKNGAIEPDIQLSMNGSMLTSRGLINIKQEVPEFSLEGGATNFYLNDLIKDERMREVTADIEYAVNIRGKKLDELYGQISLDFLKAVMEDDTLGRHQLYVDLNEPGARNRILRFTSTAFDATIEGDYRPSEVISLTSGWADYFDNRIREEFMFGSKTHDPDTSSFIRNQNITITGRMKNMELLSSYFPSFPHIRSTARINSSINVNSERLLFNSSLIDTKTKFNEFHADSLMLQMTGGFRKDAMLKNFSGLQIHANASRMEYGIINGQQFDLVATMNQDSVTFRSSIPRLPDNASFLLAAHGKLKEDALTMHITEFNLGGDTYRWQNRGIPQVDFQSNQKLSFKNFLFESDEQYLEINGTFSNSAEDSVNYRVESLDLQKLSNILAGRISFGGKLNGTFTTQTLTTVPAIIGDIQVEGLSLNNTLAGDVDITSRYNSDLERFDTNIKVSTDAEKYPEYYTNNDRRGQEFDIRGYVLAPIDGNLPKTDSLYRFDANFKSIDLWILPIIGPKVFAEGSGLASGEGVIWGNSDYFDFNADFNVGTEDAAYIRPQFLDTYYYAQGEVGFSRHDGFTFHDIYLIDPSGGNAILSGYYDFNDFGPTDSMEISLEMDEFQFLNSAFDPSLAFYGKAYGSSTVTISGTNFDPVLRTVQPIEISDFSEISIPLLEETEFNEDNRFIRFVESFDPDDIRNASSTSYRAGRASVNGNQQAEELSFAERFTLDLQFVASNPMTVRLIFDPVTGDIVTADGTGRIRILLEDEQVSMFGRFDIQGGRYQFVSGDIFTRRFELESGGTIIWEGDPANARLNLNAIYSARPDINTLSSTGTRDPDNTQRVPVDLVLNIGGTITSIENDFYFRLPDTFESQQNTTLSTQLASINRDDDLKLLQAANFMLMGDFIPVSSTGEAQTNLFGDNISGSAAVLNPLISSQVINPLLSNQVNSLLNSDLSSLDVDFNLNTYNQVDLGVALRLYNDKLILRREGQITGRQSNIGDLGATYRINRTFAVTAFHRQDLSFGTVSSTEQSQQSQDINGVGVEAKVSFNTWNEFFDRLFSPFRKLFGTREEQKDQEEITENRQGENPA